MNLRQLEFFRTLADTEHMTHAAKLLNTTQPNLSHSMSELEKELDAQLFEKKAAIFNSLNMVNSFILMCHQHWKNSLKVNAPYEN